MLEVGRALPGGGEPGLLDRSSAPRHVANRTDDRTVQLWLRCGGCASQRQLAELFDIPVSTVSAVLKRIGMGRLGRLGLEPAQRYERERPGELVHIDVKKLGRIHGGAAKRVTGGHTRGRQRLKDANGIARGIAGWDAVHVAIDDATRLAYGSVLPDEKASTAVAFLRRAIEFTPVTASPSSA